MEIDDRACPHCGAAVAILEMPEDADYCTACGGDVAEDDTICPHCGADLEEEAEMLAEADERDEYVCSACGGDVAVDAKLCPHCGADVAEIEEAP